MHPSGPGSHQAPLTQLQAARIAPGCLRAKTIFSLILLFSFIFSFLHFLHLSSIFLPSLLPYFSSLLLFFSPPLLQKRSTFFPYLYPPSPFSPVLFLLHLATWFGFCPAFDLAFLSISRLDQDGAPKVLWHDGASAGPVSVDHRHHGFPPVRL